MIGIFDSGVGGLTVLRAIREKLPSADVVYFGDTKHAPYGPRSREELSGLTADGLLRLTSAGASSIVSACNSVSASLAVSLFDALEPIEGRLVEMVGPTVRYLKKFDGRITLAATQATIDSGIYQNAFHMVGKEILPIAIPELAGAIERGAQAPELTAIIKSAFPNGASGFDLLVLACTHYPLAHDSFREALGESTALFDPAYAVAERVEQLFWPREAGSGVLRFLLSKDSAVFRALAAKIFPTTPATFEVLE
jgi:glutamate racemase